MHIFKIMNIYDTIFATDESYNGPISYKLEIVLEWINKNRFKEILDAGCGRGHYLKLLSKNGIKVTGLEPSKYIAGTLKDYEVINDDILGQAAKGRHWEALICMDVLEHIEPSEIEDTLKALSTLSDHALVGIANHSDRWHGVQLHLIQKDSVWWESLLMRYYKNLVSVYQSKRFFVFKVHR